MLQAIHGANQFFSYADPKTRWMMEIVTVPSWSSLAWRGVASIAFAVVALAWPLATLGAVTILFGAYAFADGVLALVVAARRSQGRHRWMLLFDGIFGIGAGVVTLLWPGLTLLALIILVGVRAIVVGALQIGAGWSLRRSLPSALLYGLGGLASIVFGVLTFVVPGISAYVLVTMFGVFSLVFGVMLLVWAFRLRRLVQAVSAPAT
jgi:uncharacterized membrane protein HdeD (DUF308 family)